MDLDDIRSFRGWHRAAALRAKQAGLDIVYVYAAHTYILNQFLDRDMNPRTDEYGGTLMQRARLLVCNDTGVSHIAAAVGTPSVIVASGSDVRRWAPLDRQRHRVLHYPVPCRPCEHAECPLANHPCARGVTVEAVMWARSVLDAAAVVGSEGKALRLPLDGLAQGGAPAPS